MDFYFNNDNPDKFKRKKRKQKAEEGQFSAKRHPFSGPFSTDLCV
jgi:hypothetical protein